jgi:hypothetical protein
VTVTTREALLDQIVQGFERKYGRSLEKLEKQLDNREVAEHPAWEESIEWRNAVCLTSSAAGPVGSPECHSPESRSAGAGR